MVRFNGVVGSLDSWGLRVVGLKGVVGYRDYGCWAVNGV